MNIRKILPTLLLLCISALSTGCASIMTSTARSRHKHVINEFKNLSEQEFKGHVITNETYSIYTFPETLKGGRTIELKVPLQKGTVELSEIGEMNVSANAALLAYYSTRPILYLPGEEDPYPKLIKPKYQAIDNIDVVFLFSLTDNCPFFIIYQKRKGESDWKKFILNLEDVDIEWKYRSKAKDAGYGGLQGASCVFDAITFPVQAVMVLLLTVAGGA